LDPPSHQHATCNVAAGNAGLTAAGAQQLLRLLVLLLLLLTLGLGELALVLPGLHERCQDPGQGPGTIFVVYAVTACDSH
jgi:hypothetical protein